MRNLSLINMTGLLALATIVAGGEEKAKPTPASVVAVPDADAQQALDAFKEAFKTKDVGARQTAVYDLHDVPNDLVIQQLAKLLKKGKPEVRNVAAMALGGQGHNTARAGKTLMSSFERTDLHPHEDVQGSGAEGQQLGRRSRGDRRYRRVRGH